MIGYVLYVCVLCAYANDTNLIWPNFPIVFISIYRSIGVCARRVCVCVCMDKREWLRVAAVFLLVYAGACVCDVML